MIRKLPAEVIRDIAAGEVITAPVDVIKELIDNALDAGASWLEVSLQQGGIDGISITDNGMGMSKADLEKAAESHSTSKLDSLEAITTLGFRGEGLYAIRYAAKLTLTSRPQYQLGGMTLIVQGDTKHFEEHPAPAGTKATVSQLFANLPARRLSLDLPAQEQRKAISLLSRYILHYPHLHMRLVTDGEERWSYTGKQFSQAAKVFWGTVTANRLLALHKDQDDLGVEGLISRPELARPRRDRLLLAVNGRPVQWPESLLKALIEGYRGLLPKNTYPVGIINLSLPPEEVLVNTSPDKQRIKLLKANEVAQFLQTAIIETLALHPLATPLPEFKRVESVQAAPRHAFPALRFLGIYRDLYLLAEAANDLWLIDQHAAHERIIFEELLRRYQEEAPLELPSAELLSLSAEDVSRYEERREALAAIGFQLEPFGQGQWRLRSVPAFLAHHQDLISEVVKGTLGRLDVHEAWRKVLGRLACLPAIKAGHQLAQVEAQVLLDSLRACETPWSCPHGRPTALTLSEMDIAKRFGRSGARSSSSRTKHAKT